MSHYARVIGDKVVNVIVAEDDFISYLKSIEKEGFWIQTSCETSGGIYYDPITGEPSEDQSKSLRKNFAGIGFCYCFTLDAFIPPSLYPSWILNKETCLWESPIPYPDDGLSYIWNEELVEWVLDSEDVI
jgi:hypothetical protein